MIVDEATWRTWPEAFEEFLGDSVFADPGEAIEENEAWLEIVARGRRLWAGISLTGVALVGVGHCLWNCEAFVRQAGHENTLSIDKDWIQAANR